MVRCLFGNASIGMGADGHPSVGWIGGTSGETDTQ